MSQACPCQSGELFSVCCEPFILGLDQPQSPEQLMRSRYCAYAIGGCGEYLLSTWFAPMARHLSSAELSQKNCEWLGLTVLNSGVDGDSGHVEFEARYRDQTQLASLHEKSVFTRVDGRWLYVGGEVSRKAPAPRPGRNDLCACGSGKKYKKCCLN